MPVIVGAEGVRNVAVSRAVFENVGKGYLIRPAYYIGGETKDDFSYPRPRISHTAVSSVMAKGSRKVLPVNPEHIAGEDAQNGRNNDYLRLGRRERGGGMYMLLSAHI